MCQSPIYYGKCVRELTAERQSGNVVSKLMINVQSQVGVAPFLVEFFKKSCCRLSFCFAFMNTRMIPKQLIKRVNQKCCQLMPLEIFGDE